MNKMLSFIKLPIVIVLFTLPTLNLKSQATSNYYTSTFEEKTLVAVHDSSQIDPFDLFYSVEYDSAGYSQMKMELEEMVNSLKAKNLGKKSIKKQVNTIYKAIHGKWFKKYEEKAFFQDIIKNGNFNCLTASAVYALVLDKLGYDFEIKHTLNHVYIIVNPEKEMIKMESTSPSDGVLYYDASAKQEVVRYLKNNKLISEEEFKTKSTDDLFNSYFNSDNSVNIIELGALQYHNLGAVLFEKEDFELSSIAFEKAYKLFPSSKTIIYSFNYSLVNMLMKESMNKKYNGETVGKLINLNPNNQLVIDETITYFASVTDELLLRHPDTSVYNNFYNKIIQIVNDTIDIGEINWIYNFYMGYHFFLDAKFENSLPYFSEALLSNPDDKPTKSLIHDAVFELLKKTTNDHNAFMKLEKYVQEFPILLSFPEYRNLYALLLLNLMQDAQNDYEISKMRDYMTKFESFMLENEETEVDMDDAYTFFSMVYYYYADKRMMKEAEDFVNRGIVIFPELKGLTVLINSKGKYARHNLHTTPIKIEQPKTKRQIIEEKVKNFEAEFKEQFVGCWVTDYSYEKGSENKHQKINEKQQIKINSDNQIKFLKNGKEVNGKWSIRNDAKLLYLIPYADKNDYISYKVVKITETELHVRIYVDKKLTNTVHVFKKCK